MCRQFQIANLFVQAIILRLILHPEAEIKPEEKPEEVEDKKDA